MSRTETNILPNLEKLYRGIEREDAKEEYLTTK